MKRERSDWFGVGRVDASIERVALGVWIPPPELEVEFWRGHTVVTGIDRGHPLAVVPEGDKVDMRLNNLLVVSTRDHVARGDLKFKDMPIGVSVVKLKGTGNTVEDNVVVAGFDNETRAQRVCDMIRLR